MHRILDCSQKEKIDPYFTLLKTLKSIGFVLVTSLIWGHLSHNFWKFKIKYLDNQIKH